MALKVHAPQRQDEGYLTPSHRQARLHAPFAHRAGVGTGVAPAGNAGPQSHCSQPCVGRLRLGCQVVAPRGLRACGRAEGASWLGKVRAGLRCARYIQHSGLPLRAPQPAAARKRAVASQPPACRLALLVHPRYQARGPPLTCRLPPIGEVRGHNFFRHLVAAVGRRVVPRTTAAGRVTHVRSTSSCPPLALDLALPRLIQHPDQRYHHLHDPDGMRTLRAGGAHSRAIRHRFPRRRLSGRHHRP